MAVYAANGSKLYIGAARTMPNVDLVASDFTSETWTQIKELESLGSIGDTSEAITFASMDERRQKTMKGVRSAGTMEVTCGIDPADAGQIAAIAAEKTPDDYAFRLVLNDAPVGGTPSERMFVAKVMGAAEKIDKANSVTTVTFSLAVNSNVVRINAASA